ncbi:MAG TPA: MazG nucleotide pyrophosphohydrolase domain-containing protein [Nevskiaceae bacterium]|nr:MazG nucleotide pyrophosphohydrolase domain-containing protein [Nevskiaceae bacterium]
MANRSALERARASQVAAAGQGFDWPTNDDPALWAKLDEEIAELRAATNAAERQEELGDLLFMAVNIARHLHVDAEAALAAAIDKFERRFAYVMAGADLPPMGDPQRLDAMEVRWQQAKHVVRLWTDKDQS